ncbi:MAG: hypothetical protein LBQ57_12995 [Spirochaetales bacterium]|jgi:hypothetical protein|nr:hypothetical protein [Spirochaetales bacterium]
MFLNLRKKRKTIKTVKFSALAILFIPLFSACGLNQLVYLYPISDSSIRQNGNGFEFHHNRSNDLPGGEFIGYEVFYKFYAYNPSAIQSAIDTDRTYFYQRFVSSEAVITSQGFQSLLRTGFQDGFGGGMEQNPLVRPNRPFLTVPNPSIDYTYVISFPTAIPSPPNTVADAEAAQPVFKIFTGAVVGNIDNPDGQFYVYRTINQAQNDYRKSFLALTGSSVYPGVSYAYFNAGDPDLSRLSGYTPGTNLYVGFCVVAYGRDTSFSPIYSEAVVLSAGAATPVSIQF